MQTAITNQAKAEKKHASDTQDADNVPDHKRTVQHINQLEEAVHHNWPPAATILGEKSELPVVTVAEQLIRSDHSTYAAKRRIAFRDYIEKKLSPVLGPTIAKSVQKQLQTNHSVSTAQHYTQLSPNTLSATLMSSLAYFDHDEPDRENIIAFACSGTSMNNSHFLRGQFFHSFLDEANFTHTLSLFGRANDADVVYSMAPYTKEARKPVEKSLVHYRSEKEINKRVFNKLRAFIDDIWFSQDVLKQRTYIDQVSLINFRVWEQIFTTYERHKPNLVFLSQEQIAAELITTFHATDNSIIYDIIFNSKWQPLFQKHFDNIRYGFSIANRQGTYMFWGVPKDKHSRVQLFLTGNTLQSEDGSLQFELKPEVIIKALHDGDLIPSTLLTLLIIGFYYGFHLTGGLLQPSSLTKMKTAYGAFLHELQLTDELSFVQNIPTTDFVMTRPSFSFIETQNVHRVPASAMDLVLYNENMHWEETQEAMKNVALRDAMFHLFPEIYHDFIELDHKDPELLKTTEEDIIEAKNLDQKIPPLVTL